MLFELKAMPAEHHVPRLMRWGSHKCIHRDADAVETIDLIGGQLRQGGENNSDALGSDRRTAGVPCNGQGSIRAIADVIQCSSVRPIIQRPQGSQP